MLKTIIKLFENTDKIINKQKIISIFIIYIISFSTCFANGYVYKLNDKTNESSLSVIAKPEFVFQSKSQILMEPSTGTVIYANNENEKILPASVTKVMTLLLLMEKIDSGKTKYTDIVTCSDNASKMGGSQIWFKPNEKLTIDEALKAICVVSANDVTTAVAEMLGGSESNFVKIMNEKAKELGMKNTNFMNCHGIDQENHYTTALDIAMMSRELYTKHSDILKYTSIWMDTLRGGTFGLSSTNKLIRFYEGANGIKTGSTSKALFSLSASAKKNDTSMIAVICTAPTSDIRNLEAMQLLDYGFNNYESKKILDKDFVIDKIKIDKSIGNFYDVIVPEEISVLNQKNEKLEYDKELVYDILVAPKMKNDKVGKIILRDKKDGKILIEKDIILGSDVYKSNLIKYYIYMLKKTIACL